MRGVARLGDKTIGGCGMHGPGISGTITSASPDVVCNGKGVARLGDQVTADCGHVSIIISACSTVMTNGRGTARLSDTVAGSPYIATIVTASNDTMANDLVSVGGVNIPPDQNSAANAETIMMSVGPSAIDDEYEVNDGQDAYPPSPQTSPPPPISEPAVEENDDRPEETATPVTDCSMVTTPVDYTFQLSEHFTLDQLSVKAVFPHAIKAQNGLTLSQIVCNLKALSEHVLEPIWSQYPNFKVNSGFRSRQNGKSQHEMGQAVDLQWPGKTYNELWAMVNWIKDNVNYDQLLWEHGNSPWIHVSFKSTGNRAKSAPNAVMTMYRDQFSPGLKKMQ